MISSFVIFALVILTGLVWIFSVYKQKYCYWRNKHIPFITPKFPFGTSQNPFTKKENNAFWYQKYYHHLKSLGYKFGGLYSIITPVLLLVDTQVIKDFLIKDFEYFCDRGFYYNPQEDPLSENLINVEGHKWQALRSKLTPTFTSGKAKTLFPLLLECTCELYDVVAEFNRWQLPIDVKDLVSRFTINLVGTTAFGLNCNSFKNPKSDFKVFGDKYLSSPSSLDLFKFQFVSSYPTLGKALGISRYHPSKEFFLKIVQETVRYRKEKSVTRNDFLQLLINLMEEEHIDDQPFLLEHVAANSFSFFLAGYDTTATTITFCLYELAMNPELQEKLRQEINTVLSRFGKKVSYEAIAEMAYLDNVFDETLRKYPPFTSLSRICVKNYHVPDTDVVIEKGTHIVVPVYSLHHDPEYFPNPSKFDPDRFKDNAYLYTNKEAYIPFGKGPRICIGLKFGVVQTKVAIVTLLKDFRYTVNPKTACTLKYEKSSVTLTPESTIWLDTERV